MDRRDLWESSALSGRRTWIEYAAAALAIRAAFLSLPVYHKAVCIGMKKVIGGVLTREEPIPDSRGGAMTPLQFLHRAKLEHPMAARKRGQEGKVDPIAWVNEKETFVKADVLDASSLVFVQPSIEVARNSSYPPPKKKGLRKGSVSYGFVLEQ